MENELVRPGLFRDRREAGRLLATKLTAYANRPDVVVLAETDDLVARSTVAHITGYYVDVDELDRAGNKHTLKKWIPGTAHAGIKWLAARRPAEFREQKSVKHTLDAGDAFLAFLEKMDEANKSARAQQAKVIEHCLGVFHPTYHCRMETQPRRVFAGLTRG